MGFDPITHKPRTDLVSTLPYLPFLANMPDLMDHDQTLDEHAISLQAEPVQYIHYLIQSSNSLSTTNSYDQCDTTTTNIEPAAAFSLLNSISNVKQNPVMLQPDDTPVPSFSNGIASSQSLHHRKVLPHPLHPQVCFSSQSCLDNEMGQGTNFAIISQGDSKTVDHDYSSWIIPYITPPNAIVNSTNNPGDDISNTCSNAGGHSSYLSELLFEDPILHELS